MRWTSRMRGTPPDRAALQVEGVGKQFAGVSAVEDVSFELAPGGAVGVIGPNGAGKSTLLKAIAGVHRPTTGSVHLGATRLDTLSPHAVARRGVALAHQVPQPFGRLTVRQNVEIAAQARPHEGSRADWVQHVLDVCELGHRAAEPGAALRLLDLKRLELARALATNPDVLLLDEVAAGLVGRELETVIELIAAIRAEGRSIVLVEHVEGVVATLVERVIVLNWGRVVADGTPAQIAEDPAVRDIYLGSGHQPEPTGRRSTADADAAPLLELRAVTAGYGELVALREVDLTVRPGEVVAVLGANGAGKSTLAGTVAGLVRPRSGEVRFRGVDVSHMPAHDRARSGVALSPEGRRVFAELSVGENLRISAPLGLKRAALRDRLEAVHEVFPALAEHAGQPAGSLSGGQQQMLAIGRALMADPAVLVCDEISLGLAPVLIDDLYVALERIRERGVAIVLIEQNVHRGLRFADHAVVLSRGEVTYCGPPDALDDAAALDRAYFGTAPRPRRPDADASPSIPYQGAH